MKLNLQLSKFLESETNIKMYFHNHLQEEQEHEKKIDIKILVSLTFIFNVSEQN